MTAHSPKSHQPRTLAKPGRIHVAALAAVIVAVVAVSGYLAVTSSHAATCVVTDKLVNPCRPWLGAAADTYTSGGFQAEMVAHESRIGRPLDIVHDYRVAQGLSADDAALAKRANTTLLVNFKPMTTSQQWSTGNGSNATVNASIDKMASDIKALGSTKVMLAVYHEPENNVSVGGDPNCPNVVYKTDAQRGTVSDYVAMWHNVRARFDALGVSNVVWVMNYMGFANWNCLVKDMWPGNSYVDWVMYDPYGGQSTAWNATVSPFYNFLTANSDAGHDYASKPWGLAEYGTNTTTQSVAYTFYDGAKAALDANTFPRLKAYVVWDNGANRVQYSAAGALDQTEQNHYNAFAHDAHFTDTAGTATPAPTPVPVTPTPVPPTPSPASLSVLHSTATEPFVLPGGSPVVMRGLNLEGVFNASGTAWAADKFVSIKAKGFNSVRMVVFWDLLEPSKGVYDPTTLAALDTSIARAKAAGLYVILDPIHLFGAATTNRRQPAWATTGYADSVASVQANAGGYLKFLTNRYKTEPAVAAIDMVNEPGRYPIMQNDVLKMYASLIAQIRTVDANKILIIEPTGGGTSIGGNLANFANLPDKHNIVGSYHDYFEGGDTDGYDGTGALLGNQAWKDKLGYDPADAAELEAHFVVNLNAYRSAGLPVWLGEFGITDGVPNEVAWITEMKRLITKYNVSYAWWEYWVGGGGDFSATNNDYSWKSWADLLVSTGSPSTPTPSTAPTPSPPAVGGDMNGNGKVDVFDLSYLLSKWGSTDTTADLDHNHTINVFDLSALLSDWTG